jgi:hypothetical protein
LDMKDEDRTNSKFIIMHSKTIISNRFPQHSAEHPNTSPPSC